ncbi:MAG: ribonuclease P protein component [Bacteroidetes bacterium]|nr:ribonuclease P protein component [Bacteroidota bacterium]
MTSPSTDKPVRNRLSKKEILRGYRAFGHVLSRGIYVQHRSIRFYYDIKREIPPYHGMVGFAVKKPGNAVLRNSFRRLMRESFRQRKHELWEYCQQQHCQLRCVMLVDPGRMKEPVSFDMIDASVAALLDAALKRLRQT